MPKRQLVKNRRPSNSKLIVPASASSAADRAPRSRYLRAGTAIFGRYFLGSAVTCHRFLFCDSGDPDVSGPHSKRRSFLAQASSLK